MNLLQTLDVLLIVHLSIILAADQLNANFSFYNKFIIKQEFLHQVGQLLRLLHTVLKNSL